MKINKESGYILFLNLLLITLIALFIPLLIQQQRLNFKILNNRKKSAQNQEIVNSALEYQFYFYKTKEILLKDSIVLNKKFKVFILGKEVDKFIYFKAKLSSDPCYEAEMKIRKNSLEVIYKKIYRSE